MVKKYFQNHEFRLAYRVRFQSRRGTPKYPKTEEKHTHTQKKPLKKYSNLEPLYSVVNALNDI